MSEEEYTPWLEKSDHMLVTGPEVGEIGRLIGGFIDARVEAQSVSS